MSNIKYSFDWFKEQIELKYGNQFDLSNFKWVNIITSSKCKCNYCGREWNAMPKSLLYGIGCIKCNCKNKTNKKYDTETFIKLASDKHNNKYDYSKSKYIDEKTKIEIVCHEKDVFGVEHGSFTQTPNSHLNGHGCPKCGKTYKYSTEEVKNLINYKFNSFYDLAKTEYNDARTKMILTCPKHGEFKVLFKELMRGHGCPTCKKSILENDTALFLVNNGIKYIREKTFSFLNGKRLDFYLPDYNVAIECQGEQHFKNSRCMKREPLEVVQKRDLEKFNECSSNGIKIFYYADKKIKYLFPDNYFGKIYINHSEMLQEIKEHSNIFSPWG